MHDYVLIGLGVASSLSFLLGSSATSIIYSLTPSACWTSELKNSIIQGVPQKVPHETTIFLNMKYKIWNKYEHYHVEKSFMCLRIFSCEFRSFH